ncbi:cytochrome P450 [Xylariaceae sp. FL0255]|nr:cytochrome P450 [Xylariaceae sp. FL0255]
MSWYAVFTVASLGLALYYITDAIYKLYYHPLSRYPGSAIAAVASSWYEWFWNYYQNGRLLFELERLHRIHGPVVRIGANDLSINDPEIYLHIARLNSGFTKDPDFYRCISFPGTSIGETDAQKHRIRRKVLTPALSSSRVTELAPMIQARIDELFSRFDSFAASAQPVNLTAACHALTFDVITEIMFGKPAGCVKETGFRNAFMDYLDAAFAVGWIATAFPTLTKFAIWTSTMSQLSIIPNPFIEFKRRCLLMTLKYLDTQSEDSTRRAQTGISKSPRQKAIIDLLRDPNAATGHVVPSLEALNDEVAILLTAGNDTTSNALLFGVYSICSDERVLELLRKELRTVFPSSSRRVTYEECRGLRYLTAVIKETLRLGSPLPGRLPRLVPSSGYQLGDHLLPSGTSLHLSAYLLNRHPKIWDQADEFIPERWLLENSAHLDNYVATFNRGTRQCLGKDLAWCELLIFFANLFWRYDLELIDPDLTWDDLILVKYRHDLRSWISLRGTISTGAPKEAS